MVNDNNHVYFFSSLVRNGRTRSAVELKSKLPTASSLASALGLMGLNSADPGFPEKYAPVVDTTPLFDDTRDASLRPPSSSETATLNI